MNHKDYKGIYAVIKHYASDYPKEIHLLKELINDF